MDNLPQNNKKTFLSSLTAKIILALVIFVGSAIIIISGTKFIIEYYKTLDDNKIVKQVKQTEQIKQVEREKNQMETSDLLFKASTTENWQTYKNNEFGFEVKYPEEWQAIGNKNDISFLNKTEEMNAFIITVPAIFNKSLEDAEQIKINDINFYKFSHQFGGDSWKTVLYATKNNLNYRIIFDDENSNDKNFKEHYKVFNQILSTFKFIDKDEKEVDHPECSVENSLKVYSGRTGKMLNLCGKETDYLAYEIKKENIILFQTEKWDEEKEGHYYSIKIIKTVYPYKEKFLVDDLGYSSRLDFISPSYFYQKDNLYFWEAGAEGPGYHHNLFIFSPSTEKFLIIDDGFWNGTYSVNFISSDLKQKFSAEKKFRQGERIGEKNMLKDDDIEIVVNNKFFTKKEVDEGKADSEKAIFDCNILPFLTPISKFSDNNDEIAAKYANYFPTKIPCFEDSVPNIDTKNQPIGYFDIEIGKIIFLDDEN